MAAHGLSPRWASRHGRAVVVVTLVLSAVLLYLAITSHSDVLPASDDAIYLVTAKALARGEGHRHYGTAGLPAERQYPIGYPALLALVWPTYPDNLGVMRLVSEVAGGPALLVAYA